MLVPVIQVSGDVIGTTLGCSHSLIGHQLVCNIEQVGCEGDFQGRIKLENGQIQTCLFWTNDILCLSIQLTRRSLNTRTYD